MLRKLVVHIRSGTDLPFLRGDPLSLDGATFLMWRWCRPLIGSAILPVGDADVVIVIAARLPPGASPTYAGRMNHVYPRNRVISISSAG